MLEFHIPYKALCAIADMLGASKPFRFELDALGFLGNRRQGKKRDAHESDEPVYVRNC
jgi:hypothetical protein